MKKNTLLNSNWCVPQYYENKRIITSRLEFLTKNIERNMNMLYSNAHVSRLYGLNIVPLPLETNDLTTNEIVKIRESIMADKALIESLENSLKSLELAKVNYIFQ